jgi:hypothetical protein
MARDAYQFLTDLILQKLLRVKQIENNKGKQLSQKVLTPSGHDQLFHFCTDTNGFR